MALAERAARTQHRREQKKTNHPQETNTGATGAETTYVAARAAHLALPRARSARIRNLAAQHVPMCHAAADELTTPRFAQNTAVTLHTQAAAEDPR